MSRVRDMTGVRSGRLVVSGRAGSDRRTSRRETHQGEALTRAEWARRIGVSGQSLKDWLDGGYTIDEIILAFGS